MSETFEGITYGPQPSPIMSELGRPIVIAGTGSPLGWIAAPINTIYRDNAVTGGIAFWYKAGNSSSNEWVPLNAVVCSNCLVTPAGQPIFFPNGNFILIP